MTSGFPQLPVANDVSKAKKKGKNNFLLFRIYNQPAIVNK